MIRILVQSQIVNSFYVFEIRLELVKGRYDDQRPRPAYPRIRRWGSQRSRRMDNSNSDGGAMVWALAISTLNPI
jgi:hypothetical protein